MADDKDYLKVLEALNEIPFSVGKKLLVEFLQGKESHESIKRNKLDRLESFGALAYSPEELSPIIDNLILNNLIQQKSFSKNQFWKVLELSKKGSSELSNPTLFKKKLSFNFKHKKTEITEEDKKKFEALNHFLKNFNNEQKKAIISNKDSILCIAGAGSGKTTVLTKRIEFLVRYRGVPENKILAITFTRKARQEMMTRLANLSIDTVHVETFNSFCEKILKRHNDLIYNKQVRVLSYRDKIRILESAVNSLGTNMGRVIDLYFTVGQKRGKTHDQLSNIFLNDIFFLRDYFKFKNMKISENAFDVTYEHKECFRVVIAIANYIESFMKKYGLRDFADQLLDTLTLFDSHPNLIPTYNHILIDEYQDVNSTQIKLIDVLNSPNIFSVGDPRQSIFGWRGSDIKYILNFEDYHKNPEIVSLTKNYRSTSPIVNLINLSIKKMGLPDLESNQEGDKQIYLRKLPSEDKEFAFVISKILESKIPRGEIFVLARTNRQLNELSARMKIKKIKHVVKSDEVKKTTFSGKDDVTLATIHAIKGLEAKIVFVIGCTNQNFPCKGSEHPIIDMVKVEEYDKEEEEKRLFYVAMSRAKKTLYLTYTSSLTYFMDNNMQELIDAKTVDVKTEGFNISKSSDLLTRLKEWRTSLAKEAGVPAYMILNDRSLIDLSIKLPTNLEELNDVHGFGPMKVKKYGSTVLDLLS